MLYVVLLRHTQRPISEGASATAVLVQENIGVGAAAAAAGPELTIGQELSTFSSLSLFPLNGEVCYGMPEVSSTKCVGPLSPQQGNSPDQTRYLVQTNVIVWPEAPNRFVDTYTDFRAALSRLARTANAPVIVAGMGVDADSQTEQGYHLYNSANFIRPDGSFAQRYDKMHLVPFGEYTPYKKLFFFAGDLLQDVGLFEPGKQRRVFTTGGHTYGTFICYESVFGDEIRQYEDMGADVLVNISDDGWYGDSSAAWEHLNMVRMRAIENHRWVLRATNTGVTAAIDPYGRVVEAAPRNQRAGLRVSFDYEHDITFYTAHGDWFAYLCSLVTIAALAFALARREHPTPTRSIQ